MSQNAPENPSARDLQPDVDSRNVAGPADSVLSQTGFPAPDPGLVHQGIGLPWLGLPADDYSPPGGTDPDHPHLFHLQNADGNFFDGGSLQGAHQGRRCQLVCRRVSARSG